jgi:hypothetical protein
MSDNIRLLLKFYNQSDNSILFKKINFFKESLTVSEFEEDVDEILANEKANFKIHQIMYIDKQFNEEVDLPKTSFIFEEFACIQNYLLCKLIAKL